MKNHSYFENCHDNAVLVKRDLMFKISRLQQALPETFNHSLLHKVGCNIEANLWFIEEGGTNW
jgi:hypothetical protein